MNQDNFGLSSMKTEEDAKDVAEKISSYINPNGQFLKGNAQKVLDSAYAELVSPETSAISKCMTLNVFKELTYRTQTKVFSLMSVHKILDFMQTQARTVDPRKPIHQKGAKRFPQSAEIGKQYMRTLLELIQAWGEKFAKGKNSEATKFKKNLIDLRNEGVVLPEQYLYVDMSQIKSKAKKVKQSQGLGSSQRTVQQKRVTAGPSSNSGGSGSSLKSQMRFTKDKINLFFAELEEQDDADQINKNIVKTHDFFSREYTKYESKMGLLQSQNLAEKQVEYFFKIYQFLQTQKTIYDKDIALNQDPKSYMEQLKILSERLGGFADNPFDQNLPGSYPPTKKQSNNMEKYEETPKVQRAPQLKTKKSNNNDVKVVKKNILDTVYERFADRSKSPDVGFKNVQKQLEKQKEIAKKNPLRNTSRSPKPINKSGLGGSRSSNNLKQSKVSPIFSHPPNPNVQGKNFQGDLIPSNRELGKAVFNIKKPQGVKRFKTSNFKDRSPLFENDHIQVGYKSQSLYQSINGFTHFIFLNIFVGNKTDEVVKDFQVEYKGDPNQLLYANPRSVDSLIPAGYQNKHDLLITPLRLPYCFITMHISYKFQNSQVMTSIVLPNSVLKFASYMKISKQQLWESWKDSQKYKTNGFQLCTSLPPDSFNKYIPALEYLTSYSEFASPNSQTDLEMFCKMIMLQKYEAILKIIVRPNLTVVLQLGSLENSSEASEYFAFYLQSLELVMKQISI